MRLLPYLLAAVGQTNRRNASLSWALSSVRRLNFAPRLGAALEPAQGNRVGSLAAAQFTRHSSSRASRLLRRYSMRISWGLAIAGSALSLVLIGCAAIPDDDPTAEAGSFQQAAGVGIDAPIRDLLNNPATLAVLKRDMPGMVDNPQLDMARSMSLRQVAEFPEAGLDEAKLKLLQADLAAATTTARTEGTSEKPTDVAALKN